MLFEIIPRWAYMLLSGAGLAIVAGALAFVAFVPPPAGVIIGVIWLLIGGAMAFFALRGLRKSGDDDRLRRDGAAATATVLSAVSTHVTINDVPRWAIRVRVDGLDAPYETTLKLLTHTPPANGVTFGVRVDLLDRDHVVVAAGAEDPVAPEAGPETAAAADAGQAGLAAGETAVLNADGSRTITTSQAAGDHAVAADTPSDTERLLAALEHLRESGSYSQAEYDLVKAKLLSGD